MKTYSTTDINKAAILTTVQGIEFSKISVELYKEKLIVTYHLQLPRELKSFANKMIKQYERKTLIIDEDKYRHQFKILSIYTDKKIKAFHDLLGKGLFK
ncbi:hypothetical protein [Cytobacillus horneckiae]|uniref:Uncharacterized protein n=1 Tax=Cytobacillus horneckiae TaxID=549687 RepID=A0A2N0ZMC2_9BACI|nr:hypothetical protein [Cytobacillus horneckiae]MEC1155030.1 hypothetical protein [Cytobacillus horneckiae]MED2936064.1 hypothetical protein [Cytobacillus horneckiae]PKG30662.1 hypothetical protein CWS20_01885 [Cytobacillus horneckiae]